MVLGELSTNSLLTFKEVSLPHTRETGKSDFTDSATRIAPANNQLYQLVHRRTPIRIQQNNYRLVGLFSEQLIQSTYFFYYQLMQLICTSSDIKWRLLHECNEVDFTRIHKLP